MEGTEAHPATSRRPNSRLLRRLLQIPMGWTSLIAVLARELIDGVEADAIPNESRAICW